MDVAGGDEYVTAHYDNSTVALKLNVTAAMLLQDVLLCLLQ